MNWMAVRDIYIALTFEIPEGIIDEVGTFLKTTTNLTLDVGLTSLPPVLLGRLVAVGFFCSCKQKCQGIVLQCTIRLKTGMSFENWDIQNETSKNKEAV